MIVADPGVLIAVREGDAVRIIQADPVIWVSDELLQATARGRDRMSLDESSRALTIQDDFGGRYVYRVGRFDPEQEAWLCSWPD